MAGPWSIAQVLLSQFALFCLSYPSTKRALGCPFVPKVITGHPFTTELIHCRQPVALFDFAANADNLTTTSPACGRASLLLSVGIMALALESLLTTVPYLFPLVYMPTLVSQAGVGTWFRPLLEASSFAITQPP